MSEHHHRQHSPASAPEEAKALLAYMTEHNRHHVEELLELCECLPEEAGKLVQKAAETLRAGTDQLEKALEALEE